MRFSRRRNKISIIVLTDDDDNSLYDGNQTNILKLLYGAANIHHEHYWKDSVIYSTSMMQNGLTQSCWTAVILDDDGRLGSRKRESGRDIRSHIENHSLEDLKGRWSGATKREAHISSCMTRMSARGEKIGETTYAYRLAVRISTLEKE